MSLLCAAIEQETANSTRWATLVASQLSLLLAAEPARDDSSLATILDQDDQYLFVEDW
jgi:hypothetical protein